MRRVLPSLLIVVTAAAATGEEPLTLREAMARARQNAREVAAAQSRHEAARARLDQAKGFRLPGLKLEENWIRTNSPADAFALQLNQKRFSFNDFVSSDPNNPAPLNTAITRLEASLPLYTGGELSGKIHQAELAADSASGSALWAANQAAWEAGKAFVMLSQAEEYVTLLKHARDTVEAHVDLARAYEKQGMLVRSDLLRAEVELSHVEDMLTEAKGRVRIASANLAFRLGVDQGASWSLAPLARPSRLTEGVEGWLATAEKRQDLQAARQMLRAGELEESVRRAAFMPKVGVVGRADWVDDKLFGTRADSYSIMAQASINLFAGGSDRAAVSAARWDAKAGREDVLRFDDGVRLEVRQAYEETVTAAARQETAAKALAAAQEAERITRERFAKGVVKMLDLLDASTARREAETRELAARADANAALLRLALVSGRAPESVLQ
ncbi:MAG: TolC family protein [Acidobacteriota bacterium]